MFFLLRIVDQRFNNIVTKIAVSKLLLISFRTSNALTFSSCSKKKKLTPETFLKIFPFGQFLLCKILLRVANVGQVYVVDLPL